MKMHYYSYICKIAMMLLVLPLLSCSNHPDKKENSLPVQADKVNSMIVTLTDAQLKNARIDIGSVQMRKISSILKVNGIIDVPPQNRVSISFPMGGYLKSTQLLPGMHIRQGEAVAVMEDQQFIQLQQDYLMGKAKLTYSEKEFLRQLDLNASKASSDKVFQQAQADYESQKIMVRSLAEKLRLIGVNPAKLDDGNISRDVAVHSPINGYVTKVNVNIGKYVNPADVLFEIVDPSDIHLALDVFEKDVSLLYPGQKVSAYTNSDPGKKYNCKIILIGKDLSDQRKTEVHCHFLQNDPGLIPGTFMNAEIEVKPTDALALPDEAIVQYGNKNYAFVVKNKYSFEMREVKTGNSKDGFTELVAGDNDLRNQFFVTKGAYSLLMKMKNTGEDE
jgi:cobalt-zinc-cadmium efflux system membrane fusion protein